MRQLLLLFAFLLPVCVHAQWEEPFDGPAIGSRNPWSGDVFSFSIQDGWLVSQADVSRKSASLTLPVNYAATMQWESQVIMDFKPSNQNHIRFYVYSGQPENTEEVFDYFLQIGSNNHSLSFRRQARTGKTSEVLFEKAIDALSNKVNLTFKLTLEEQRTWSLYVKEENAFVLLASCDSKVSPLTAEGFFRFECRYTKTRADLFACNYIRVLHGLSNEPQEPEEDQSLPQLLSMEVLTRSAFQLTYDQPIEIADAVFELSEIGKATSQKYVDLAFRVVEIGFGKELDLGKEYRFSCSGIKDRKGNKIPDFTHYISLTYDDGTPEPDKPTVPEETEQPSFPIGCVRINEVMADPPKGQSSLSETEYVELYNTSNQDVDLTNWFFFYGDKSIPLTSMLLEANAYVVLYQSKNQIVIDDSGSRMPLDDFPYRLANTGKELALYDPSGNEIDRVAYAQAKQGVSWERSDNGFYLSTDQRGGTPGSVNSTEKTETEEPNDPILPDKPVTPQAMYVFPKELVFNEILPDPNSGGSEYIEFYNRSDRAVSLAGLCIATRKSDGELSTRYSLSSIPVSLEPKAYLLVTKNKSGVENFYSIQDDEALHELRLPVLANTTSTLVLFNQEDDSVVDEVNYSEDWHSKLINNKKGIALERIDPEGDTQDPTNWTSASTLEGGGTPGYQNSQYMNEIEGEATGIEVPTYSELSKDYTIAYQLDQPGYVCRAWIFDVSGRRIGEVLHRELLGVQGELKWNGQIAKDTKVKTGLYIFYVELVHPTGKMKRSKAVFVVK